MHPKAKGDTAPWADPMFNAPAVQAPHGSAVAIPGSLHVPRTGSPVVCRRNPQRQYSATSPTHPSTPPQARCHSLPESACASIEATGKSAADASVTNRVAADGAGGNGSALARVGAAPGTAIADSRSSGPWSTPTGFAPEPFPSTLSIKQQVLSAASCQQGQASRPVASLSAFRPSQIQSPGAMQPRSILRGCEQGQGHRSPPMEKAAAVQAAPLTAAGLPMRSPPRVRANAQSPSGHDASVLAQRLSFSPQRLRRVAAAAAAAHGSSSADAAARKPLGADSAAIKASSAEGSKKLRVIRAPALPRTCSPSRSLSFQYSPSEGQGPTAPPQGLRACSTSSPAQAPDSPYQQPTHLGTLAPHSLELPCAHRGAPHVGRSPPGPTPLQAGIEAMQRHELQKPAQSSQTHVLRWLQEQQDPGTGLERDLPLQELHSELSEPSTKGGGAGAWRAAKGTESRAPEASIRSLRGEAGRNGLSAGAARKVALAKGPDDRWPGRVEGQSALDSVSRSTATARTLQPQSQWVRGIAQRGITARQAQTGSLCTTSSEGVLVPRSFSVEGNGSQAGARAGGGTPSVSRCSLNHSMELLLPTRGPSVLEGGSGVQARRLVPRALSSEPILPGSPLPVSEPRPPGSPLPAPEQRALGSPTLAAHARGWVSPPTSARPRTRVMQSPGGRWADQKKGDPLFCALAHCQSVPGTNSSPDRLDLKGSHIDLQEAFAGGPLTMLPHARPRSPSSTRPRSPSSTRPRSPSSTRPRSPSSTPSPTSHRRAASASSKLQPHATHQHHLKPILSKAQCYVYSSSGQLGLNTNVRGEVDEVTSVTSLHL